MCFSFQLCLMIVLPSRKKKNKSINTHKIFSPTCPLLTAIRAGGNLQILLWLSTKIFTALLIPCLHPAIVLGPDKRRCKLPNMVNIVRSPRIRALYSRGAAAVCVCVDEIPWDIWPPSRWLPTVPTSCCYIHRSCSDCRFNI